MDDSRISRVTQDEVMGAEAYMLFYRVIEHPTLTTLQKQHKELVLEATKTEQRSEPPPQPLKDAAEQPATSNEAKKRKRQVLEYLNGEEWAAASTGLGPAVMSVIRRGEEFIADNSELNPKFFSLIEEAAKKDCGAPEGPLEGTWMNMCCAIYSMFFKWLFFSPLFLLSYLTENDIQGGKSKFYSPIKDMLYKIYEASPSKFFKTDNQDKSKQKKPTLIVPPVADASETVL